MVRDVERLLVYLNEKPQATLEPAPNVFLGNIVPTGGNARADPRHGKIWRWKLDEVQHRPKTKLGPATQPRNVTSRCQSRLDRQGMRHKLGRVEAPEELAGRRRRRRKLRRLTLELVRVQKRDSWVKQRHELSRERRLARAIRSADHDRSRFGHCENEWAAPTAGYLLDRSIGKRCQSAPSAFEVRSQPKRRSARFA
jgi:hypothetical protein